MHRRSRAVVVTLVAVAALVVTTSQVAASAEVAKATTAPDVGPKEPRELAIAMFGDSTALMTAWGLDGWGTDTGRLRIDGGVVQMGCGIGLQGERRYEDEVNGMPAWCDWPESWPRDLAAHDYETALVLFGPWDIIDRRLSPDDVWRAPGDPPYDTYLRGQIRRMLDLFEADGVRVLWLTSPTVDLSSNNGVGLDAEDARRMRHFDGLVRELVSERENVEILDMRKLYLQAPGGEFDTNLRPDGVHLTRESARAFADALGPVLLDALRA